MRSSLERDLISRVQFLLKSLFHHSGVWLGRCCLSVTFCLTCIDPSKILLLACGGDFCICPLQWGFTIWHLVIALVLLVKKIVVLFCLVGGIEGLFKGKDMEFEQHPHFCFVWMDERSRRTFESLELASVIPC